MKLIFSLCLAAFILIPLREACCRDIILVENGASHDTGLLLRKILENKFQLPRKLITLKNIQGHCDEKTEALVHLCLMPNGELKVLKMNQFVVKNSFGIFMNQEKNLEEKNEEGKNE